MTAWLISLLLYFALPAAPSEYDVLRERAEISYAEKSYAVAHRLYEEAGKLKLSDDERRWVEFRLADTAWRDQRDDNAAITKIAEIVNKSEHDRVWAEANEALGDYYASTYSQQPAFYTAALEWWANSSEIPLARKRYLQIVFKMSAAPQWNNGRENAGGVPRNVLVDAMSLATDPDDVAHLRYLLALQLLGERRPESIERGLELLDLVIREGKKTNWYDDALMAYADQLANFGDVVVVDGETTTKHDYAKALELYRRITTEFKPSETRYHADATQAALRITSPSLSASLMSNFLPDSEQEVMLSWRNVGAIELSIAKIDLTGDLALDPNRPGGDLASMVRDEPRSAIRRWTYQPIDNGPHAPGMDRVRIAPRLEMGAYLITATSGRERARTVMLVSDINIITHAVGTHVDAYVSDVMRGAPVANARVHVWRGGRDQLLTTDADGIARIAVDNSDNRNNSLFVTAAAGPRQAYLSTYFYWTPPNQQSEWRIYAFTDRPAYRPNETVHWKIVARTRTGDGPWQTPAHAALKYEFTGPRGEHLGAGTATLNEYGSFWADLPLTSEMALGPYRIELTKPDDNVQADTAELFTLEEYKLPEYTVSVTTPQKYRLGDTVEAIIEARYYFGGPVNDATVEVKVDRTPYNPWTWWYADAWWAPAPQTPNYYGGQSQNVLTQTLRTDADGRAVIHFETPRDGTDSEYTINASVTDASRRVVSANAQIVVMKQSYRVVAHAQHSIGAPNEKISVDFKATDAQQKPVKTTGKVHVVRRQWEEKAYREEDVLTTSVSTDDKGEATFTFTPARDGYYQVSWSSEDRRGDQPLRARDIVKTETSLWITRNTTTDFGYHAGGLELIVDRETLHAGDRAPLIVMTENSGRYVLLTTSGADVIDTQLVRLDGTAKLIELPIDQRHVPDFNITASSVFERTLRTLSKTIHVPPEDRALTVDVKSDEADYRPRQKGTLTVTTRDYTGKPVPAEVALSLSDESVTAIAEDPAGDPRPFFYGGSRVRPVSVNAGVQAQRYARLIVGKDGRLVDEATQITRDMLDKMAVNRTLYARSGDFEGAADAAMPPPAPAPPPPGAVAEAITVTAAAPAVLQTTTVSSGVLGANAMDVRMEVVVRSDFRSTAFWKPDVVTDANGTATVEVQYPEALTQWRATARAVTGDTRVGMATAMTRTNQRLIVRLQAPRFFVAGDRSIVSAVINNNDDDPMQVTPELKATGVVVTSKAPQPVNVPPHGEVRVDWTIAADKPGMAKLTVSGSGERQSDGMEKTFRVYEHGIDKLVARSGKVRGDGAAIKLDLPNARRDTSLVVKVSPSLASAMLDALPYLIDYPYGCTEQTMSRFLPAAIVGRTLAKEHVKEPQWFRAKLNDVTKKSLHRLYDFQHDDGGWGWWQTDDSQTFMTAYVIWGFAVAKEAGVDVNDEAIERGVHWLDDELVTAENDPNAQAWMLHALAAWHAKPTDAERTAFNNAYAKREKLSAYGRALLALAAHGFGEKERAQVLLRNLENGVKFDRAPDRSVVIGNADQPSAAETMATAHWGADRFWWHWYEGPVESTAFALQALVTIDPNNQLIEPVMNWLVKNRRGSRWNNTRDTAIALLALTDYLRASGETSGETAYEVTVNGRVIGSKSEAASFTIDPELVRDANEIAIRRTRGRGPLYFSVEGRFVSLEEPVKAAGHELFVKREYIRLVPKPTLLKGVVYDEVPLREGESLKSGDRVDVVLTIETKNDYEYLLFEDLKPAGLEAVSLNSGSTAATKSDGDSAYVYQELRDRNVALFADELEQGIWTIRYQLRAETPGEFHALPVLGEAMYVPDVRANGEETRITVTER